MYNILIPSKVDKMISKIAKGDKENAVRILFAIENLKNANDPFALKNCEKMGGLWKYLSLESGATLSHSRRKNQGHINTKIARS